MINGMKLKKLGKNKSAQNIKRLTSHLACLHRKLIEEFKRSKVRLVVFFFNSKKEYLLPLLSGLTSNLVRLNCLALKRTRTELSFELVIIIQFNKAAIKRLQNEVNTHFDCPLIITGTGTCVMLFTVNEAVS